MNFTLSTIAKVALGAGVISGGLLVSNIAFNNEPIAQIKGNVDNMKNELAQAISDNEFLSNQFKNLKTTYDNAVQTANALIGTANSTIQSLKGQISDLKAEAAATDDETEKALIQAEINRLESELDAANMAVLELQAYVSEADAANTYTAVDREEYTFNEAALNEVESGIITSPTDSPTVEELPTEEDPIEEDTTPEPPQPLVINGVTISDKAAAFDLSTATKLANNKQAFEKEMMINSPTYGSNNVTPSIVGVEHIVGSNRQGLTYVFDMEFKHSSLTTNYKDMLAPLNHNSGRLLHFFTKSGTKFVIEAF